MHVPAKFIGDTGLRKNNTEEAMTTTLFTQFPTECVTGVTCCKIIYDTCWYKWKVAAVINTLCAISANGNPLVANAAGVNFTPSTNTANGKEITALNKVITENKVMLSIFTPFLFPAITFFENTFLD